MATSMLEKLRRYDDHGMAWLRRMYARHVVRGRWHFWADFGSFSLIWSQFVRSARPLGMARSPGYMLRHE
jgi:hypothetical protein